MRKSWICRPPEIVRLQSSGRWDLGSHAHLGHVQIPIDDKLTGSLPHESSVSSRPAPDRNERRVHRPQYSRPRRLDGPVGRTRAPGTRILRLPIVCPLRRSRKSHCGVNVSGGNARRREPQGHDQSRPCPTKTEPNGRGGEPLPTGMGRQIDDDEPARYRYRPTLQQELRLDDPRPHGLLPTAGGNDQPTTLDPGPERSRRSAVGTVPDHDVAELHRHS